MYKDIRDVIQAINTVYRTLFTDAIDAAPDNGLVSRVTQTIPTTRAIDNLAWLTDLFHVSRAVGERESIGGFASEYLLRNEVYRGSKSISVVDIEDGNYIGRAEAIAAGLAAAYTRAKNRQVQGLMTNAFTVPSAANGLNTIDGAAFFSASHPWWSLETVKANGTETSKLASDGTFSNLGTAVFSEDALWDAYENFLLMKNHYGDPAEVMPNLLVVGPTNARLANTILKASNITREVSAGVYVNEANDTAGMFEVLVDRSLGTSPKWFLYDTSSETKPFLIVNRKDPQFQTNGNVSFDDSVTAGVVPSTVYHEEEIQFGVRGRFGAGYGLPYYAFGSTGTV